MKLLILSISFLCARLSFAQCTPDLAAKLPVSLTQYTNLKKYKGDNRNENKAYTEIMYKKLLDIFPMFEAAFKDTKGFVGTWRAQVDDISNEGLVQGYMEISMQPVTCKTNGEFNKSTGKSTFDIVVNINGFNTSVIRDKNKARGFTAKNDKDSLNGRLLYLISEKQHEESFRGFPLYYVGFNNSPYQSLVVVTKPNVPLFEPITIRDFVGLFRTWTAGYHPDKPGSNHEVTLKKIDKFVESNSKDFFDKPCITIGERTEQFYYILRDSYADDATQGNPWVIFNPAYINKNAAATSIQFISIQWGAAQDPLSKKALHDFKTNFDFKRFQQLLEPGKAGDIALETPAKIKPSLPRPVSGECATMEDANNSPTICKRGSAENFTLSKEADKWMSAIYSSVIGPAIKSTTGFRGEWQPQAITPKTPEGFSSSRIQIFMNQLGCISGNKLHDLIGWGLEINFSLNSLWPIGDTWNYKKRVINNQKTLDTEVPVLIDGRQGYILRPQTESEKYSRYAYYRKEKGGKYIVISNPGVPFFLPVSIKDVLTTTKTDLIAQKDFENRFKEMELGRTFEAYLLQEKFEDFKKDSNKEEAEKRYKLLREVYDEYRAGLMKSKDVEYLQIKIDNIEKYLQRSSTAQLAKPCILNENLISNAEKEIEDRIFLDYTYEGSQYVTLNPASFKNKASVTAPQFISLKMLPYGGSSQSLRGIKSFEDNLDFRKLEDFLSGKLQ